MLHAYDDETLHQLRVTLRRLRSLLRNRDSSKARQLRRELRKLADISNAARDWDTLVSSARERLSPQDFERLQPWLEERQAASHRPVLDLLRSDRFSDVMRDLKKFVRHYAPTLAAATHGDADLSGPKQRVYRAWRTVQSVDDNRSWHKLRVAIKELRYCLENIPKDCRNSSMSDTLKHCKRLQDSLGIWHDTVIHLRMLREFGQSSDSQADMELLKVLQAWCDLMEREARDYLDRTLADLQGKAFLLPP